MASRVATPGAISTTNTRPRPAVSPLTGERWRRVAAWLAWGGFALVLVAAAVAPLARTGDAHQYYAMATALADLRPPSLTADEVAAFKAWLQAQPESSGFPSSTRAVDQPPLIVAGRQEFSHFWLYPLLAAPVVRVVSGLGLHPGYAFLVVNAGLLAVALWQVRRTYGAVVAGLVLASPLIWFVNKGQVEVFTVSLLAIAMAQAGRGRWLGAGLAAAIASTQNAPILGAVACFWGAGLLHQALSRRWPPVTARTLLLIGATVVIGALHPAYYFWRLGVLTPQRLNGGIDLRLPSLGRYVAVLLDPDIGLLPWLPMTGFIALLGLSLLWRSATLGTAPQGEIDRDNDGGNAAEISGRPSSLQHRRLAALCGLVIGAWFLFVFAQTTNVNSGGTVHISRYALWLLPLALPLLAAAADWLHPRLPALLPVAGGVALLGYLVVFQPAQPERYVTQSPQSAFVTTWLPELYRAVPEIFYERQAHADGGVRGAAATASCRVILVHAADRALPCALSVAETTAAEELFARGWEAAWIVRPGPLRLGEGGVTGALPRPRAE